MNAIGAFMTAARAQLTGIITEDVIFNAVTYQMAVGAGTVADQIQVNGYWVQADIIAVVDKAVFTLTPDRTRSQFTLRGRVYRLYATEEDATSWTFKLKANP